MKKPLICAVLFATLALSTEVGAGPPSYIPRPDGLYDNNNFFVDPEQNGMERAINAVAEILVETAYDGPNGSELKRSGGGSGVIIGSGKYILTVAHILSAPEFYVQTPEPTNIRLYPKKYSSIFLLKHGQKRVLNKIFTDSTNDIALLETLGDTGFTAFPYPFGNSDDLMLGNVIYIIGNPLKLGVNIREGIVSSFYPPEIIGKTGVKRENVFMISRASSPGDSGSPVVAIRDGRYEIVGFLQGFVGEKEGDKVQGIISYVLKINSIKKVLQENLPPEIFSTIGGSAFGGEKLGF